MATPATHYAVNAQNPANPHAYDSSSRVSPPRDTAADYPVTKPSTDTGTTASAFM